MLLILGSTHVGMIRDLHVHDLFVIIGASQLVLLCCGWKRKHHPSTRICSYFLRLYCQHSIFEVQERCLQADIECILSVATNIRECA